MELEAGHTLGSTQLSMRGHSCTWPVPTWRASHSRGALAAAHAGTLLPGSATACVMRLNRDTCALSAANVGDSGFMVVRRGQTIFRSEPQEHFFDCPYQFAASPEFAPNTDHVDSAAVVEVELQAGDIIVAGTDGLWDNLPEAEVLTFLPTTSDQVQEAAQRMAEAASAHANDETYESPYTREALKRGFDIPWWQKVMGTRFQNGGLQLAYLRGGKLDDITVPRGTRQLKVRTKLRSSSGSSNSFSDLARLAATPHSFRSESSLLSRSSEPITIPECRNYNVSPSAQIWDEAAASYTEAYRESDNSAEDMPSAQAACQVPAEFLRELELWLQQSQDASLETVQSLRMELEQRSHLLEDCIALCQRQESDLCFDLD
ncbi:hypothetical protein WJX73_006528 [Symbiochloris irregularis]|uniref:Protein phosphatase n=1 Tax=Symbiochloris irregularis TaxID=706552 RepID=A0AAW1NYJ9_9CHLO